ncbi:MAG: SpoIIE family protein phosphatase [Bryobacterales bacterium]|nr:SpoIIE family protein phosphatase [Bryobacterales bacterium]
MASEPARSRAFADVAIVIRAPDAGLRRVPLGPGPLSLGRSAVNDLCYPDDPGLSRRHLLFEPSGEGWAVRDLGSKNGTQVNGVRIAGPHLLEAGDRVSAGRLNIEYQPGYEPPPGESVSFVDSEEASVPYSGPLVTTLHSLMGRTAPAAFQSRPVQALIKAGQELLGHRPLEELFQLILDLSVQAVGASRGVLMTLERGELVVRAARGEGFRISTAVRDRILSEKASLLVRDAQFDDAFRERQSIVQQHVRSMMAVPLQTRDQVTGLIYVDMPHLVQPFAEEELSLLTVMANVAAIRIEQARLVEVEQAERIMARELAQAAEIQRALLPDHAPEIPGFQLAGHTESCRTVGGDYYDYLPFEDGRLAVLAGDVAGKGMSAALLMSSLQARVQVLAETRGNPAEVVERLNRSIAVNCPDNRFITFFYSVLDPATGELRYSNAGHNPPLVVRSDGTIERLETGGTVLGILPKQRYEESSVILRPGDLVAFYTDGVTEACPADRDEEFDEERLARFLIEHRFEPAAAIIEGALACLRQWMSGAAPGDDLTLVVVRSTGAV